MNASKTTRNFVNDLLPSIYPPHTFPIHLIVSDHHLELQEHTVAFNSSHVSIDNSGKETTSRDGRFITRRFKRFLAYSFKLAALILIMVKSLESDKIQAQSCTGAIVISAANGNTNSSSFFPSQLFQNITVYVQDDFEIDNDFTIDHSEMIFDPGVRIILTGNHILSITSTASPAFSHLHACTDMWGGIEIISSAALLFINNNSLVEDAENAIHLIEPSYFEALGARFNRNYRHIFIDLPPNSNFSQMPIVESNEFLCKDNSGVNANALLPPHMTKRTETAIEIIYPLQLSIGHPVNRNLIENSETGISSIHSKYEFTGFDIKQVKIGIDCNFDVTLIAEDNYIENAGVGIKAHDHVYHVELRRNTIRSVKTAIHVYDNPTASAFPIAIEDNIIENARHFGVRLNSNNYADIKINNNVIVNTCSGIIPPPCSFFYSSTGISVTEAFQNVNSTYRVHDNQITNFAYGIYMANMWYPVVKQNTIYALPVDDQNKWSFGIRIDYSQKPEVIRNVVTGDPIATDYWWSSGIMVDNCPEAIVLCNETGNTGRGLWFGGIMPKIWVAGNIMYDCFDHLFLNFMPYGLRDVGRATPIQLASDNEWQGTHHASGYNTFAYYSNDPFSLPPGFTTFHVRPGLPYEPADHGSDPPTSSQNCTVNVLSNPGDLYCTNIPAIPDDDEERELARGMMQPWPQFEPYQWLAGQYLHRKFKEDPLFGLTDSLLMQVRDSLEASNIASFTSVADSIAALPGDSMQAQATQYLAGTNAAIIPEIDLESYYKSVNEIYLGSFAAGQLPNAVQDSVLRAIALLCPYEGGPAVYAARAILLMTDTIARHYNTCDTPVPLAQQRISQANVTTRGEHSIRIAPNPGNGVFRFLMPQNLKGNVSLTIFDISGRKLINKSIKEAELGENIDLSALQNGVFIYTIEQEGKTIHRDRLVIIR